MSENNPQGMTESEVCNALGWVLIVLGFIVGLVFIFSMGRVEVESYYLTKTVWSGTMIFTGIGIMFNGFLIGYLFQKIASILRYHEQKN